MATSGDDTQTGETLESPDALIGRVLQDRFEVLRLLARGGMGAVYVASDRQFGAEVAVKFLRPPPGRLDPASLAKRFTAEAKVLARLRDPRILRPLSWGQTDDGFLYLVTELLDGQPLDRVLRETGGIGPDRTVGILIDTCRALSEAHASGVLHRNLKPANLFLQASHSGEETTRVLDFGIAKITHESPLVTTGSRPDTRPGGFMGTVGYMAPEQVEGKPVTERSDLYSLGVVAYHCLTGELPFEGEPLSVMLAHVHNPPPVFGERVPGLTVEPRLEALVLQMLEKDPFDRPASAREVRKRLEGILGLRGSIGGRSDPEVTEAALSPPRPSRGKAAALLIGSALIGGSALALWGTRGFDTGPEAPTPSGEQDLPEAGLRPLDAGGTSAAERAGPRDASGSTEAAPVREPERAAQAPARRPKVDAFRVEAAGDALLRLRRAYFRCTREGRRPVGLLVTVLASGSTRVKALDENVRHAQSVVTCTQNAVDGLHFVAEGPIGKITLGIRTSK